MQKLLSTLMILTSIIVTGQTQNTHPLDLTESVINWKGTYAFLFSEHTGTVHFKEGELQTTDGHITGGTFVIDMTTISNEDYLSKRGAVEHLRDTDFFDVAKYPNAMLEITNVIYHANYNEHKIEANLTIKGITQPINFIAFVDADAKRMITKFKIDRTRWGITYNNKVKNKAIAEAIEFNVLLQF